MIEAAAGTPAPGIPPVAPAAGTPPAGTPAPGAAGTPAAGEQPPAGGTPQPSGSLIGKAAGDPGTGSGNPPNAGQPGAGNSDLVGAPEGYGVYNVPEGIQMDVGLVTELNGLAKDMNLSQVGAQRLVDLQVKMTQKQDTMASAQFNEMKANWETETKKELGTNYDADMALAGEAARKFATPELLQLWADTGIGNHKAMVVFLRNIRKAFAEDAPVVGAGAAGEKSRADKLFPKKE